MYTTLQITEIIVCVLFIAIVLMQKAKVSLNLSTMSSSMWAITKRGPEKVLHNAAIVLWVLFILNSLALVLLSK